MQGQGPSRVSSAHLVLSSIAIGTSTPEIENNYEFWRFGEGIFQFIFNFLCSCSGPYRRQPIAVSDISTYICLIDIRSKSKERLNERRAGLST